MQSVGTLQSYLQFNQLENYSTSDIGWITEVYMFLSYFFNIQVGPICDHFGPMIIGPIGIITTVGSFLLLAQCETYWQFMLCFGVLGSLGGAIIGTVAMSVIAKLFSRRQGLAMGLTLAGSAVGSIIFPIMLRASLIKLGWRWAMRITAFFIAAILVPGFFCFRPFRQLRGTALLSSRRPKLSRLTVNFSAFRSPPFAEVMLGSFLLEFAIFGIAGLLPIMATTTGFSR